MASVIASALLTKYRVTAAAVPPSELETIAISTPSHSPKCVSSLPCCEYHVPRLSLLELVEKHTAEIFRFGSKADIRTAKKPCLLYPKSGHWSPIWNVR